MSVKVLPQWHAGVQFRSTLEARWAIFFDHAGIGWEYEPEGFVIDGRPYRPDFLLDCGTWVEVKGDPERLDLDLMLAAARELPGRHEKWTQDWEAGHGVTPKLLILGSIPEVSAESGGIGWIGLEHYPDWYAPRVGYFGFRDYTDNIRLTDLDRGATDKGAPCLTDLETIWPEAHDRLWDELTDAALAEDEKSYKEIHASIKSLFENLRNYGDAKFFLTPKFFPAERALPAYWFARAHRFGSPA